MTILVFSLLFFSTGGFAVYTLRNHWKLAKKGVESEIITESSTSINSILVNVVLQKKLFKKPVRGIFHSFIFFGFIAYAFHTMSQMIGGFTGNIVFYIPSLFPAGAHLAYDTILDLFTLLVIAGVVYFFIRRYILLAPELDRPSPQSIIVITMIFLLMVFTLIESAARGALSSSSDLTFLRKITVPLLVSGLVSGDESDRIIAAFRIGWWGHVVTILLFLAYVPTSKHAHLFWAPVNFWFTSIRPKGRLTGLDVENAKVWGAGSVHEFSWKTHLDGLSCIECGRCQLVCPANRTGKALSPKKIMTDMKHSLKKFMPLAAVEIGSGKELSEVGSDGAYRVLDQLVSRDEIWACTTCYACVEACPVGNNQVEPIIQMRRSAVLNEGALPAQLQGALTNIENQFNPWGLNQDEREKWAEGLDVPLMREVKAKGETPEYLYWVGCAGAFDDRNKKIARTFVSLLKKAGVSFAILGTEESCTGDSARRGGNEYLYQTLASANVETLNGYGVQKIIATCPHCFNTLLNEYPDFGGKFEVIHHTKLLEELVAQGKLELKEGNEAASVVWHDSCYLGRYNGNYDPARNLLSAGGLSLVEPSEKRENALCCGAGGAQMWMEEMGSDRVNFVRTQQLLDTGAKTVASGCPFCLTMITDGVKAKADVDKIKVKDISEIISERIK